MYIHRNKKGIETIVKIIGLLVVIMLCSSIFMTTYAEEIYHDQNKLSSSVNIEIKNCTADDFIVIIQDSDSIVSISTVKYDEKINVYVSGNTYYDIQCFVNNTSRLFSNTYLKSGGKYTVTRR